MSLVTLIPWVLCGLLALSLVYVESKRRTWLKLACDWRELWDETHDFNMALIVSHEELLSHLSHAAHLAASFGKEEAFEFLTGSISSWEPPDELAEILG